MSSIQNIASGDLITNSRTDINNNFTNLNTDKIETSVLDTDTTLAANSDTKVATQKAVKSYIDAGGSTEVPANFVIVSAGAVDSGKGVKLNAIGKLDTSFLSTTFGGTGANGALSISSGTTTLDLGGASYYQRNYTSLSITGTGALTFSNPHANGTIIDIRVLGNTTLTSSVVPMINARGMGGLGGTGGGAGTGVSGSQGHGNVYTTNGGAGAPASGTPLGGLTVALLPQRFLSAGNKYPTVVPGAGGGDSHDGGNGAGSGGGVLILSTAGTFTFTTVGGISVSGIDGKVGGTIPRASGAGGGGVAVILYNIAGTISGTVTSIGGTGTSVAGTGGAGAGGSGVASNGGNGSNSGGGSSGAGGNGFSLMELNNQYV